MIKYLIKHPQKWSELELYNYIPTFNLTFDDKILNYLNAPTNEIAFIRSLKPVEREIYERLELVYYNDDNELLDSVFLFAENIMRDKAHALFSKNLSKINEYDIGDILEDTIKEGQEILNGFTIESQEDPYDEAIENVRKKMLNDYELIFSQILTEFFVFSETELTVIGARPSVGKTALALCIMLELCPNISIDFFSAEMPISTILYRLASYQLGLNTVRIKNGKLTGHEFDLLEEKIIEYKNNPNINLYEAHDLRKILRIISNSDSKMFIVDYAQLITTGHQDRRIEVDKVVRELKLIANSKKKIGVLLSQVGREASVKRPTLKDLKETGGLEEHANNVVLIHSIIDALSEDEKALLSQDELEECELIIAKYRDGDRGVIIKCKRVKGKFLPLVESDTFDEPFNNDLLNEKKGDDDGDIPF